MCAQNNLMMRFLRRYQYHIFLATMAVFLSGTFIGFGSYFFGKGPMDTVAEVNGEKIPVRLFWGRYQQAITQIPSNDPKSADLRKQKRDEILRDLIQSVVFQEEARRYGIFVPDQQVVISMVQIPAFIDKQGHFDPSRYSQTLQALQLSPKDFEEEQRRQIAFFKLRWLITSCIKVTDKETEMAYAAQHNGSMKGYEKEAGKLRDQLLQDKTMFVFNQWFAQISQRTRVKMRLDAIEGRS